MFLSAVIPLTALNTPNKNQFWGRAAHAFFMRQVAHVHPEMAKNLHAATAHKPFTISALLEEKGGRACPVVAKGAPYYIRFTSLDAELTELLLQDILPALPKTVELGKAHFEIGDPIVDKNKHPYAGCDTPEAIFDRWFGQDRLPNQFTLRFISPTASRRIRREWVLPTPSVIFDSYLRKWNAFGHRAFDGNLTHLVEADVYIRDYRLNTSRVRIGDAHVSGWMGRATYHLYTRQKGLRAILHTLADFAQYAGTGYKTTQGLGQTQPLFNHQK